MKTFLNVFLDVVVCLSFILSTVALIAEIKKFSSRAEKIAIPEEEDPDREKKQQAAEKSLFRLEMMVLNPLPPAIPPVPTLYIELAGRFPGGAVVDAAPLIVPLLLHEYT